MAYWLMKSEPDAYSWDQLWQDKRAKWDGVRNHQAANNLKAMQIGDEALFYHSNIGLSAVGVMKIIKTAYPDPGDPTGRFVMVDVAPVKPLPRPVELRAMKAVPALRNLAMLKQVRLSVSPVTEKEWITIMAMAKL